MSEENPRSPQKIISEITTSLQGDDFIYRGINEVFNEGEEDRIRSSLYKKYRDEEIWNEHFKPPQAEEEQVGKAKKHFRPGTKNIEILTDLRHFGANVNLIDFSHNLSIALFVACNGKFEKSGEIIILPTKDAKRLNEIDYKNLVDGIIDPVKTDNGKIRVVAQSSIFVYPLEGYLSQEKWKWTNFEIYPTEKKAMLEYLDKIHNISKDTFYNDLIGFIQNERNYENTIILAYRALSLHKQGQYREALQCYDKVIDMYPRLALVYNSRGMVKLNLGEYEQAIEDFDIAIEIDPQLELAYNNRGMAKINLEKNEQAIKDFNKAIELDTQLDLAYSNRGWAKLNLGEYEQAIKDFDKAIELDAQLDLAYSNRGWAKFNLGEYEQAITDFNKAIEINPQFSISYHGRGIVKEKMGLHEGAAKDFNKAKEIDPDVSVSKFKIINFFYN